MSDPNTFPVAADPQQQKKAMADESNQLHQQLNTALKSEQGGAPVHVFQPDMPAEAKKDALMQNAPEIPTIMEPSEHISAPLATDIGSTANDKVAETLARPVNNSNNKQTSKAPGAYVEQPVPIKGGIPDWYSVGWTGFSNLPNPGDEKAMQAFAKTHSAEEIKRIFEDRSRSSNGDYASDLVAQFVNEKYFGEWYHNCGVVFVAIFCTWLLIKIRLGLMSCLIVGAFFGKCHCAVCVCNKLELTFFRVSVCSNLLSHLDQTHQTQCPRRHAAPGQHQPPGDRRGDGWLDEPLFGSLLAHFRACLVCPDHWPSGRYPGREYAFVLGLYPHELIHLGHQGP